MKVWSAKVVFITAKIAVKFISLSADHKYDFHIFSYLFITSRVYYKPTKWSAPSWLVSSVGRALHGYGRGHGFKSRTGLTFLKVLFHWGLSSVHYCEYLFHIRFLIRGSPVWFSDIHCYSMFLKGIYPRNNYGYPTVLNKGMLCSIV